MDIGGCRINRGWRGDSHMGALARWRPWPGAAVDIDWTNRLYWFNGQVRSEAEFDSFTGAVFGAGAAKGLTGAGVAGNHDISIAWSKLGIAAPFTMATILRPTAVNGTVQTIVRASAAASPNINHSSHQISAANQLQHQTSVSTGSQALQSTAAINNNTVYAICSMIMTDKFYTAINGVAVNLGDASGSLPTYSLLRFLENMTDGQPFIGAIRRLIMFQHVGGAEPDNATNAALSATLMTA